VNDVKEGVIAARIAAHAADIVKGIDVDRDHEMAKARKGFDWQKQFELSIDPHRAGELRKKRPPLADPEVCSMCSQLCAIKMADEYLRKLKPPA
jgi:phosphomethylpyrimidine synthase